MNMSRIRVWCNCLREPVFTRKKELVLFAIRNFMWNLVIAVQNQQRWRPGDSQWHLSSLLPQFRSKIHLSHPILLLLSFIITKDFVPVGVYVCLIWLCYDAGSENRSGSMLLRRPHHGRSLTLTNLHRKLHWIVCNWTFCQFQHDIKYILTMQFGVHCRW